jgi:YfiH family protein
LVGDPKTGAYAAIHAGWRGTVQSIVVKAIGELKRVYGSDPKDLICAVGPAAGCENYEIGQDVIDAFTANFDDSEKYFTPTREGHALVDLHAANCDQLLSAGVRRENIHIAPFCTMERPDLFFSYRLEKQKFGKTGRLLSVVGRRSTGREPST